MRNLRFVACAVVLLVVASGCQLLQSANRYAASPGSVSEPFWCEPSAGVALNVSDCRGLSAQLDFAVFAANAHHTAAAATADGATSSPYVAGVGAPFRLTGPTAAFDPQKPDTLLYDGIGPTAQVVGIEWNVTSASAPAGFVGPNDTWNDQGDGTWRLRTWILRPFQNEPDVFADIHPCLEAGGPVYDVTAACYTSTHPNPLRILVTNDDGYHSPGIDAAVEELRTLPNVAVTVSAPAANQSGTGRKTTPGPLTATDQTTLSGYAAKAVQGYPADSVLYALNTLHMNPDLLVSGINDGQNISLPISNISGTVGAARQGGLVDIPALAVSQGFGSPPDFPSGAAALRSWVDDFLLGRAGPALFEKVVNINVPTCAAGSNRGTKVLPLAPAYDSSPANCLSTVTSVADDVAGFLNGYITQTSVGTAGSIT
jgi:5'-nucleotidase